MRPAVRRWAASWRGLNEALPPAVRRVALLLRRSVNEYLDDHCPQLAAAISYHVLFSLFPLAIAAVGVLAVFMRDADARETVAAVVVGVVPLSDSGEQELHTLLTSIGGGFGALGLLGLLGVLWSATGVMAALRTALNAAWDTDQRRTFIRGKAVDLLLVAGTFLLLMVTFGATLLVNLARQGGRHLPSAVAALAGPASTLLAMVLALALLTGTALILFRLVPAVPTRVREIWPGALVAAAGVLVLQYSFSVYVSHFADYNRVYGSLGAIVAFLLFVYLAASALLFGAEVSSEYPRLPGRDGRDGRDGQADRDGRDDRDGQADRDVADRPAPVAPATRERGGPRPAGGTR